jgi:holliday junction DNA helicase RuvB
MGNIVDPARTNEDLALWKVVRPNSLSGFIGEEDAVRELRYAISAAKTRNEVPEPVFLWGPPGTGKTTLARCVANEVFSAGPGNESPIKEIVGGMISSETLVLELSMAARRVIFIDEIHSMQAKQKTVLLSVLEEGTVYNPAWGKWTDLKSCTVVAATSRPDMVPSALRDRFGLNLKLEYYSETEMEEIAGKTVSSLEMKLSSIAIREIARRSRSTPRLLNRLIKRVRDRGAISDSNIPKVLDEIGVDHLGLTKMDRDYLGVLIRSMRPVGINAIAGALSSHPKIVEEMVEGFLMRKGYISISASGRVLGPNAIEVMS